MRRLVVIVAAVGIAIAGAILATLLVSSRTRREDAEAAQRSELVPVSPRQPER